jgi:hypothetical protein
MIIKNPKYVFVHTQGGILKKKNPHYDPSKCEKCGKKHGWFQKECK